jgi:hypothetical protein
MMAARKTKPPNTPRAMIAPEILIMKQVKQQCVIFLSRFNRYSEKLFTIFNTLK